MYKNQLQELAQRSCFNLPSYASIREGPDHAPRFKASVTFNGETFIGPSNCTTLRQAEHAAAEVALSNLSTRGPSKSLTAKVLDETGVYKNLLQETAHRAGLKLPVYTTIRSGPGHSPVFSSTVELAGMSFSGEPAKTKKQAEKNAAMSAWAALKQMPDLGSTQTLLNQQVKELVQSTNEEQDQVIVAKILSTFKPKEDTIMPLKQRPNLGLNPIPYQKPHSGIPEKIPFPKPIYRNYPNVQQTPHLKSQYDQIDSWTRNFIQNSQKVNMDAKQFGNLGTIQVPSVICRSGFNAGAMKAPMVHMRSVIPVYAARPAPVVKKEEGEGSNGSKISKPHL